jgi:predicted nucleotidyltransferase
LNYLDIVDRLKNYADKSDKVSSLFAIGSYARGEMEVYSDIDMVICSPSSPGDILNEARSALSPFIRFEISGSENKVTMFLSRNLLRVDLIIVRDPSEVKELIKGSRISNFAQSILVDKSNSLLETFEKWNAEPVLDVSRIINEEISKFLISYESASVAARKEDVFQSYFQYNLSLTRLVRLIQLEKGNDSYLYVPKRFMNQLPLWRRNRIERLSGSLRLAEIRSRIDSLAIEFRETHSILYSRYRGIDRTPDEIREFLKRIQARDMVWNFRDIAWVSPELVNEGCLFRSSSLARFDDRVALSSWLQEQNIRRIIDLRLSNEIGRYPYSNLKLEIVNIPLAILANATRHIAKDSDDHYVKLLDNPKAISDVFHLLSEKIPTVIHCHAGRDRTAVIAALVELTAGLSEDEVKRDFAASNMDVRKNQLDPFLSRIKELGGIEETLKVLGVRDQDVTKVQAWLLEKKRL